MPHLPVPPSQVQEAEAEVPGVRQAEEEVRVSVRGMRNQNSIAKGKVILWELFRWQG